MNADPALDLLANWVRVMSLRTRLLRWYDREKRDLPWRRDRDPYRVLVSEFMLQQTRVDVVIPYFERWMTRWPTLRDLAAASQDEVLAAWSGLGYYRRARSLHALAQHVTTNLGGELPRTAEELDALPGVGAYTAAAIASISFDEPVAVVDGNVERVIVRLICDHREPGTARDKTVAEAARRLVTAMTRDDVYAVAPPEGLRAADWNQAMMELGAVVCLPGEPRCAVCPWAKTCIGHRAGFAAELPRRKEKRAAVDVTLHTAVVRRGDTFLLVRRPEGTLLSGLWELPTTREGGDSAELAALVREFAVAVPAEPARTFRHSITHRRITVRVYEIESQESVVAETAPGIAWVRESDLRDFGVSSMTKKALRRTLGG